MYSFFFQNYILVKVENIHIELKQLVPELKKETTFAIKKFNWDLKYAQLIYRRSVIQFIFYFFLVHFNLFFYLSRIPFQC